MTTLCPGGKERMRRLMAMVAQRRVDLRPRDPPFRARRHLEAYELFSHQRDGVLKVALSPDAPAMSRQRQTVGAVDTEC